MYTCKLHCIFCGTAFLLDPVAICPFRFVPPFSAAAAAPKAAPHRLQPACQPLEHCLPARCARRPPCRHDTQHAARSLRPPPARLAARWLTLAPCNTTVRSRSHPGDQREHRQVVEAAVRVGKEGGERHQVSVGRGGPVAGAAALAGGGAGCAAAVPAPPAYPPGLQVNWQATGPRAAPSHQPMKIRAETSRPRPTPAAWQSAPPSPAPCTRSPPKMQAALATRASARPAVARRTTVRVQAQAAPRAEASVDVRSPVGGGCRAVLRGRVVGGFQRNPEARAAPGAHCRPKPLPIGVRGRQRVICVVGALLPRPPPLTPLPLSRLAGPQGAAGGRRPGRRLRGRDPGAGPRCQRRRVPRPSVSGGLSDEGGGKSWGHGTCRLLVWLVCLILLVVPLSRLVVQQERGVRQQPHRQGESRTGQAGAYTELGPGAGSNAALP